MCIYYSQRINLLDIFSSMEQNIQMQPLLLSSKLWCEYSKTPLLLEEQLFVGLVSFHLLHHFIACMCKYKKLRVSAVKWQVSSIQGKGCSTGLDACLACQRPKRPPLASPSTAGRTLVWHLGGLLPVSVVTAEPGLIKIIFFKKINWIYCLFKLGF